MYSSEEISKNNEVIIKFMDLVRDLFSEYTVWEILSVLVINDELFGVYHGGCENCKVSTLCLDEICLVCGGEAGPR